MVSIQEAIYYMHKEAKALYFNRVRVDIVEARKHNNPMRTKAELLKAYRQNVAGYNKIAQRYGVPFGVLLYAEVTSPNNRYWWMNALHVGHLSKRRVKAVADLWGLVAQRAANHDRYIPSSEIVEVFKNQLTTLENT